MSYLRQFNQWAGENRSLIRKALDSATNVGEALIPEHLERVITNIIVRLSPVLAMISSKFDRQKFHQFNRLISLPTAGGAMGESAVTPTRQAAYSRQSVQLKVMRRKGSVTNFLQDTSGDFIDAAPTAHGYDLEHYILYGNADANSFEHSGVDHFISTNRIQEVVAGVVPTSLQTLDDMIDRSNLKQAQPHSRAFIMSPEMLSKMSRLLDNVRLNQGLTGAGMSQVEIPGGWRLWAYRNMWQNIS